MIARNVKLETLEGAARKVGVKLDVEPKGRGFRVKVYPSDSSAEREHYRAKRYACRTQAGEPRMKRVYAVCWHGFRDFFRAVYAKEPKAIFRTAMATYNGRDDFRRNFEATGDRNIGSMMIPLSARDGCACEE